MPLRTTSAEYADPGQIDVSERWLSVAAGLGLTLQALRSRGVVSGLLLASAGLSLLARGATGYCAVKSALAGDKSLVRGAQEQARRLWHTFDTSTVDRLDSMDEMYLIELQELHSAEAQLDKALRHLIGAIQHGPLALRLDEYAAEIAVRKADMEQLLARANKNPRAHPDDAMRALLGETEKMAQICAAPLRDAAIAASVQRIVHYKIAGYGTIAAYAKALGRSEDASYFADLAARDKTVDGELSRLSKGTLNVEAVKTTVEPPLAPGSLRTH
jgi:ferritin-like metal-binding protein YciE